MVVHNGVRQEGFIDAAVSEIECRSVIQGTPRANACKQPIVLAIPEPMHSRRKRIGRFGGLDRFLLIPWSWSFGRLRCGRRVWIPALHRLLLRLGGEHGEKKKKRPGNREPYSFPHTKTFCPFVSPDGSTDCGQARKGCKGGKNISSGISSPAARTVWQVVSRTATLPLGIVSFPLTPQDKRRTLPATFSVGFWSGGRDWFNRNSNCDRFTANGNNSA